MLVAPSNQVITDDKAFRADLAIGGHNDPDPDLFGRRLMRLGYAICTGAENADLEMQSHAFMSDPASLDWILWTGDLLKTAPGQWICQTLGGVAPVVTATEVETAAYLAEDGLGCCNLPRLVSEHVVYFPRLRRCNPEWPPRCMVGWSLATSTTDHRGSR